MQFEIISIESMTYEELELFEKISRVPQLISRRSMLQSIGVAATGMAALTHASPGMAQAAQLIKCVLDVLTIAEKTVFVGRAVAGVLEYVNPKPTPVDGPIGVQIVDSDGTVLRQSSARVALRGMQMARMRVTSRADQRGDMEMVCRAYDSEASDDFEVIAA
jgi:hypothetical protein